MEMTMQKILAKASGNKESEAGEIIMANIDVAMTHDLTEPLSVESFEKIGLKKVWDSEKIVISLRSSSSCRLDRCSKQPHDNEGICKTTRN